jgi:sensor histidine kinase regulating citrate/malate metabolism
MLCIDLIVHSAESVAQVQTICADIIAGEKKQIVRSKTNNLKRIITAPYFVITNFLFIILSPAWIK